MSNYNGLMNSHFKGCEVYGHLEDKHRNRRIILYHLTEYPDLYGCSDGVDSWVADKRCSFKDIVLEAPHAASGTVGRRTIVLDNIKPVIQRRKINGF